MNFEDFLDATRRLNAFTCSQVGVKIETADDDALPRWFKVLDLLADGTHAFIGGVADWSLKVGQAKTPDGIPVGVVDINRRLIEAQTADEIKIQPTDYEDPDQWIRLTATPEELLRFSIREWGDAFTEHVLNAVEGDGKRSERNRSFGFYL